MNGKISAAILTGGAATRFDGRVKSKIVIGGETIISKIISVVRDIFDELIIVTNNPEEFADFIFCSIVRDEISSAGPLGGIHAAMKASSNDAVFVFAGDMPFLDRDIIIKLIDAYKKSDCNALIPVIEENIEPLHSIYRISLAENLGSYLRSNQSFAVRDYIKTLNVTYLKLEGSEKTKIALTNINSPSDIDIF
jgi:molybdopterin-guanine dinucleotide biosynthesis protein A